jgi:hypothetical protein
MKVEEAIDLINKNEDGLYCISDTEDLIEYEKILAEDFYIDRHRWYETSTSFYRLEDGILGISGLSNIYSEETCASVYDVHCYAFEAVCYLTVSYKPNSYD